MACPTSWSRWEVALDFLAVLDFHTRPLTAEPPSSPFPSTVGLSPEARGGKRSSMQFHSAYVRIPATESLWLVPVINTCSHTAPTTSHPPSDDVATLTEVVSYIHFLLFLRFHYHSRWDDRVTQDHRELSDAPSKLTKCLIKVFITFYTGEGNFQKEVIKSVTNIDKSRWKETPAFNK